MAGLETRDVAALSSSQVKGFTTTQLGVIQSQQLAALTTANITGLTTGQVSGIASGVISALETRDLAVLSTAQVAAFTTTQVGQLTSAQLGALSSAQVGGLTTAQVNVLTSDQIAALSTANVAGLTTSQVAAINTTAMAGLETRDVAALTSTQLRAFTTSQLSAVMVSLHTPLISRTTQLTTAQLAIWNTVVSPLVLDLDGNGVTTRSLSDGVIFDIDGDGRQERTGWVGQTDGLLARDLNSDGIISGGSELFGTATRLADGSFAKDGFEALAALDLNHDGVINSRDEAFSSLRVWRDADSDGYTDVGELQSLPDAGVSSISLRIMPTQRLDQGNFVGLVASYERLDGTHAEIADVWFQVSRSEVLDLQAAELSAVFKEYEASAESNSSGLLSSEDLDEPSPLPSRAAAKEAATIGKISSILPSQRSMIHELSAAIHDFEPSELLRSSPEQTASIRDLHREERRYDRDLLGSGPVGGGGGSD